MNFPKVRCSICKEEVSKRSTVLLKPLTGGDGRGCRTHPEVSGALDDKNMQITMKFVEAELEREEEIKIAALAIRTLNIVFEVPMDRAVVRLRTVEAPAEILSEARKRVEAMSPEPSLEENMSLVQTAIALVRFGVV